MQLKIHSSFPDQVLYELINNLGLPKNVASLIKNTWKKIKAQRPIIALTKSDECNLSAPALSKLSELKGKIGLVSGTRSIIDSLLFTDSNILTKYMKENF